MKILIIFLYFYLLFLFSFITQANELYEIHLEPKKKGNLLKINILLKNNSKDKIKLLIKLEITKIGKSGKAKAFQSSYVILEAGEKKKIEPVKINILPQDKYIIDFKVYKNNKLIMEKRIEK